MLQNTDLIKKGTLASKAVQVTRVSGLALGLVCASFAARAGNFDLDNGVQGRWGLDTSLASAWRTRDASSALIGKQNGGQMPSTSTDDGNLNYRKQGDNYSAIAKVIGEIQLQKDGFGVFVRAKGWYDYALMDRNVRFGSIATNYAADQPLSDHYYTDSLSKFSGFEFLDWYGFGTFSLAESTTLGVKLGSHVVNWGENLFIGGGINQYNPIDVAAARRPGAQLKEVVLPTPQLSINLGVSGVNVEAFYKFKTQRSVLEGCGTYWSASDGLNCRDAEYGFLNFTGGLSDKNALAANLAKITGVNQYPEDKSASYGIALKKELWDVDLGAYFVNYATTSPRISLLNAPSTAGGPLAGAALGVQGFWDWSAENIKVWGLSAATNVGNWSVFGELSYTQDYPVQINGSDLVGAYGIQNGGILAQTQGGQFKGATGIVPAGGVFRGYELKDKTQIQISALNSFSNVLGAESLSVMGEVAYQHWSGIGDPSSSTRYGRGFEYGIARWSVNGLNGACTSNGSASQNAGCAADGFATSNAWGYRLLGSLQYNNAFAGVNLTPRIFFAHDVSGYSADNIFLEGRKTLSFGVRADYLRKFYADLSYTTYASNAKYDSFRDRDNVSAVIGMSF